MTTLHFTETTTATEQQFIDALTDFGKDRPVIFGNSQEEFLTVHATGTDWADVTEGSKAGGGVWERLRYDWSRPGVVRLTTMDSNAWGGDSGHTYRFTPGLDGVTTIRVDIVREGKNLRGRILAAVLAVVGRSLVGGEFRRTVRAVEKRAQRR